MGNLSCILVNVGVGVATAVLHAHNPPVYQSQLMHLFMKLFLYAQTRYGELGWW